MIEFDQLPLSGGVRFRARLGSGTASWAAFVEGLTNDASFRERLTQDLASAPFDAFFWECNAVSATAVQRPFEMVVMDAPALGRMTPSSAAFSEHLGREAPESIRSFDNLSGDARLVVPTPLVGDEAYPHLAAFVRNAPAEQIDALWQATGLAVSEWLASKATPMWLSTSGLGVAWVHVRLDSRPKYYTHHPYRLNPQWPLRTSRES